MTRRLLLLVALVLSTGLILADAQQGIGERFGARDPRTCSSRKASPSAVQARQYLICDIEGVANPTDESGGTLNLLTDVTVQVGAGRPFNMQSDSFGWATTNGIDSSQTVYPIRGSFTTWSCVKLGYFNGVPGKNCSKSPAPAAKGICFKSSFGEWHCMMTGGQYPTMERYPPPTGQ